MKRGPGFRGQVAVRFSVRCVAFFAIARLCNYIFIQPAFCFLFALRKFFGFSSVFWGAFLGPCGGSCFS